MFPNGPPSGNKKLFGLNDIDPVRTPDFPNTPDFQPRKPKLNPSPEFQIEPDGGFGLFAPPGSFPKDFGEGKGPITGVDGKGGLVAKNFKPPEKKIYGDFDETQRMGIFDPDQ